MEEEKRSLIYEERFKKYLFKGDINRFIYICNNISILNNLTCLEEYKMSHTNDKEKTELI